MIFDILIANGTIIDGAGKPIFKANIGIKDDRIATISTSDNLEYTTKIDASENYVCPGFIDVHTYNDMVLQLDSRSISQVRQGVTTQVIGLAGVSFAPVTKRSRRRIGQSSFFPLEVRWRSYEDYLNYINHLKPGTNIAGLVGHGSLRNAAMDIPASSPNEEEVKEMVALLDTAICEGAFGLSTGLEFNPGKTCEMSELVSLCRILAKHNALHATHTRNRDKFYLSALHEVLDVTKASGARLQISHINPKYGRHSTTMQDLIDSIKHARTQGFYIALDVMPSEWNHINATAILPIWAQNIPADDLLKFLKSPDGRKMLKDNPSPLWQLVAQEKWDRVYQFGGVKTKDTVGLSIKEIAKLRDCNGWDTLCQLLVEEAPDFNSLMLASDGCSLDDIALALKDPYCSVVSDSMGLAKDGPLAEKNFSPNTYDWVTTFFKNFVLNKKPLLSIEEAVQKLTSIPARQLKINKRGLIEEGYYADIVILDPEKLKTSVTLKNPREYTEGVQHVLVNGKIAYQEGSEEIHCHGKALKFDE